MSDTKIFNETVLRQEIIKTWGHAGAHIQLFDKICAAFIKNKPSSIDNRQIKCSCNNPDCKTGLNFDTLENGNTCILLTDRNGNEHAMHTTPETIKQITEILCQ